MGKCSGDYEGTQSGTGKSQLVEALGHLAIDKGKTVPWHTLETLAQLLRRHRADDSINKAIGKLIRADLVVVDDVGLLPVSADAAEALFRVIDAAYEKRSVAIVESLGLRVSRSEVSGICSGLDEQVELFRQRPLEGAYPYLWLDAKVRHEALLDRAGCKTPPLGCHSSPVKLRAA
jgi:predicted ATPase